MGLGFFFGRGSRGGPGKPFDFETDCSFVCCGGTGFSMLGVNVAMVTVPSVPCSDEELIEATRVTGSFITSLGLTSSGI